MAQIAMMVFLGGFCWLEKRRGENDSCYIQIQVPGKRYVIFNYKFPLYYL
jgi:hypothetical protein